MTAGNLYYGTLDYEYEHADGSHWQGGPNPLAHCQHCVNGKPCELPLVRRGKGSRKRDTDERTA